ncbi:MAG: single-stranded-DNA-specific exonuclease RecJ [Deltaproteobacteria bacterium]|nr:single-stranded-DNA-specific exonuclease RecJ [Deltaproteobacteria bacterium]
MRDLCQLAAQDLERARSIERELSVHPLVARVLSARGVGSAEQAKALLHPRLATLTPPEAMLDREAAATRIAEAIVANQRIVVFGDYDVDGATSASLAYSALSELGGEIVPHIASRFDGGYGFSDAAADRVLASKPTLVITFDCGTSDHERLFRLKKLGIDTIVVDHHKVPDEPLPAVAFLNPNRPDCGFPFKGLASVGLALSLIGAVRNKLGKKLDLREYLDLVAVGTIADVAPLSGDNRTLTRAGLDRLAEGKGRPGLSALLAMAKLRAKPRAFDVGFSIAPMLNAPGRMGSAEPSLRLLNARTPTEAKALAQILAVSNEERRRVSQHLCDEALAQVAALNGGDIPAGVVAAGDGWHHGVGGIVAARLVDRFQKPSVVIAIQKGEGVGSARAPRGFPLFDAISACSEYLTRYGGHDAAAGLSMRAENVDAFRLKFAEICQSFLDSGRSIKPTLQADTELTASDLKGPLVRDLGLLEPTGQAWTETSVLVQEARLESVRLVGINHLRGQARIANSLINVFIRDGVGCRERGDFSLAENKPMQIVAKLRPDSFAGPEAVQLDITATRPL